MHIKRNLEGTILKYLPAPEIITVVGPRQCGKTTMINHIIKKLDKAVSVSFDDQNILGLFEKSTDNFINAYIKGNKYLFIDEFHYAKNGGKILKYIFDTQKIKIIISGSFFVDLTVKAIKHLVGRILVFNLYPFDFYEFLSAKDGDYLKIYKEYKNNINLGDKTETKLEMPEIVHKKLSEYYEEYLIYGGYPRVVIENNYEAKKNLLLNLYNTYFLREVKDILGLIDDYKLNSLIKGLALQIGSLVEYSELGRLSGFSYPSLKKYLNFLEKTYICRFIKPFYKNKRTEIVKNPKVYFFDSGLRNIIVNDFRGLEERTDGGALLENGLAMQFIKKEREFNFWRDKKKNELDFILSLGGGKKIAVESKSYFKGIDSRNIDRFKKAYPDTDIYVSYKDIDKKTRDKTRVYPVYLY